MCMNMPGNRPAVMIQVKGARRAATGDFIALDQALCCSAG
jgi:hypothetical protein